MKKGLFLFMMGCLVLTGCAKERETNQLQNVEEKVTTEKTTSTPTTEQSQEESYKTEWAENDYTLSYYLPDKYFYDVEEMDFFSTWLEKCHIKVLDAFVTEDLAEAGSYFVENQAWIQEFLDAGMERDPSAEPVYLAVKVELTNLEEEMISFCMADLDCYMRVFDDSMVQYGVSDTRTTGNRFTSELFYDLGFDTAGKRYYYVDMEPGKTITTTILYLIYKEDAQKDLYLQLGGHITGEYDSKLGRVMPKENDPKIRYIRLHLNQERET